MVIKESSKHPYLSALSRFAYKISPEVQNRGMNISESLLNIMNRGYLTIDRVPFPETVDIELTPICNLRCRMCWWWGENGIAKQMAKNKDPLMYEKLSTTEVLTIMDEVADNNSSLYLSGAEVFTRPDIMEILKYAHSNNIPTALTTNGTLIKDYQIRELSKMNNLRLNFSIDGLEKTHDYIRGKGNFEKTITVIKKLLETRGVNRYPVINTNTTFSSEILGEVHNLIDFLINLKVDGISFQHLWFTSESQAKQQSDRMITDFNIDERGHFSHVITTFPLEYIEKLASEVDNIQRHRYRVPVRINPRLSRDQIIKYYTDLDFSKRTKCFVPWNKILIKADGKAMFCPDEWITKWEIGNIRNQSISELWNNDKAVLFRNSLISKGLFPICGRCCGINMN